VVVTLLAASRFIGMNKLRVATVALTVPLILLLAGALQALIPVPVLPGPWACLIGSGPRM